MLNPKTKLNYGCNCRMEENYPLDNKCRTPGVVYEAKIKAGGNNDEEMRYTGLTNGTFKQRYANHCKDFKYSKYEKSTKLSKYVWKLKNEGKSPMVEWSILKHIDNKPRINYCKLCLTENYSLVII